MDSNECGFDINQSGSPVFVDLIWICVSVHTFLCKCVFFVSVYSVQMCILCTISSLVILTGSELIQSEYLVLIY